MPQYVDPAGHDPIIFYRETIRRLEVALTAMAAEEGVELQGFVLLPDPNDPTKDRLELILGVDQNLTRIGHQDLEALLSELTNQPPEA